MLIFQNTKDMSAILQKLNKGKLPKLLRVSIWAKGRVIIWANFVHKEFCQRIAADGTHLDDLMTLKTAKSAHPLKIEAI